MSGFRTDDFGVPQFGCGPADIPCLAQESAARFIGGGIIGLGDFMTDMLANAFIGSRPGESSWTIADGQFWFWVATMGLVISIVACFQLAPAAIMRDGRRIAQVAVGLVVAVPSSVAAVYVMRQFVTYGGETTDALVATVQDQSLGNALLRMFGYRVVADVSVPADDGAIAQAMTTAKLAPNAVIGQYTVVLLILAIMALAALFLYVSMSIRSFSLVALAATAPIGLVIAEPLAAAILVLSIQLVTSSTDLGVAIVAAGVVFAAAFAPLWAVRLVSFAGDEVRNSLQPRPHVSGKAQNAMRVLGRILAK